MPETVFCFNFVGRYPKFCNIHPPSPSSTWASTTSAHHWCRHVSKTRSGSRSSPDSQFSSLSERTFRGMRYGSFCDMPTPSKNSTFLSTTFPAWIFRSWKSRFRVERLRSPPVLWLPVRRTRTVAAHRFLLLLTAFSRPRSVYRIDIGSTALTVGMEVQDLGRPVMRMTVAYSRTWGGLCLMGTRSLVGEKFLNLVRTNWWCRYIHSQ